MLCSASFAFVCFPLQENILRLEGADGFVQVLVVQRLLLWLHNRFDVLRDEHRKPVINTDLSVCGEDDTSGLAENWFAGANFAEQQHQKREDDDSNEERSSKRIRNVFESNRRRI